MFDDHTVSHDADDDMRPESNLHGYHVVTSEKRKMYEEYFIANIGVLKR